MPAYTITWRKVAQDEVLRRSSHAITTHGSRLYIFGGEKEPRKPVEIQHAIVDLAATPAQPERLATQAGDAPSSRIGLAATSVHGTSVLFSGRDGTAMTALVDEPTHPAGLWSLSHSVDAWEFVAPVEAPSLCPVPRSYHALTSDNEDLVYLHAGCLASGRLADFWSFSLSSREWSRLSHAPGPARGGTSIVYSPAAKKIFRFGGFDGNTEVGGLLDFYDPETDDWSEIRFEADGKAGPLPRSVAGLVSLDISGQPTILSLFGEGSPSNLGHAGAGKFFGDVWAWDVTSQTWHEVKSNGEGPTPRGWFSAATILDSQVIVSGGLAENNQRLDDVWVGTLTAQ